MKKTFLCAMLAVMVVLVFACKSQPKPAETTADAQFKNIYDRYRNDLIFDGAKKYTVVSGDILVKIARTYYHDGFFYPIIMLASSDVVLDPDKIEPGMELTIPDLQKNLADAKAKASIKNFLVEIAQVEELRNRHSTAEGLRQKSDSL